MVLLTRTDNQHTHVLNEFFSDVFTEDSNTYFRKAILK